jgi:hypothetical protein
VRFVHGTVKLFVGKRIELENESNICRNFLSNNDLAKTCLTYLGLNVFDTPCLDKTILEERLHRYKFSRYVAQFWSFHTKGAAENDSDIRDAVVTIFESHMRRKTILQIEKYVLSTWGDPKIPTRTKLIHVIAINGLTTICRFLLNGAKVDRYIPVAC